MILWIIIAIVAYGMFRKGEKEQAKRLFWGGTAILIILNIVMYLVANS